MVGGWDEHGEQVERLVLSVPGKRGISASIFAPKVVIDGVQVEASYGLNEFVLPAGIHQLEVHPRPSFTRSHASATVDLPMGQETQMFYTAPISSFGSGSLSATPGRSQTVVAVAAFSIGLLVFLVYFWVATRL